ncbi:MAG: mechanosensitive ion channel family protein [Myxococcota bacterium]
MFTRGHSLRRTAASLLAALGGLLLAPAGAAAGGPEPSLRTPRVAMRSYLEACRAGDYELGAQHLDLRKIPSRRRAREGPRLARELKVALDQELWVELDQLSDDPAGEPNDGLPPGVDRVGTIETRGGPVEILLLRHDARWRIAPVTVARIPELYAEFGFGVLGHYLPQPMFVRYGELELWQWLGLLAAVVLAYGLGLFLSSLLLRVARRLVGRTRTTVDDRLVRAASGPLAATLSIGLFALGTLPLRLSVPARRVISELCQALIVLSITWLAMRIVDLVAGVIEERFRERGETTAITVLPIGRRVVKVFLVLVAALSALQNMGYNVTGLIAGLGVGGLAVALAAQKTFENFFGAVSVLIDQPVKRGDFCRFGDKLGIIEDIGLRSTRIRTLDRTLVTVPNADFSSMQLENFGARDRIRFHTVLGLRYETSADQLRHVLIELRRLLLTHPRVDPDPARVRFVAFGAFSLDLEIFAYISTSDWNEFLQVREDLLLRIIDVVEASGTGFAFPSQTLYLGRDEGLDAARAREAEERVRRWREQGQLCLPDFPEPERERRAHALPYPEEGSALRTRESD